MYLPKKLIQLLVLILVLATGLLAGKPSIVITGAFVTPRADLSAEDALIWRSQLQVAHQFGENLTFMFSGEYAPKLLNRPEGFNLYSAALTYRVSQKLKLKLGRINRWNSLLSIRYDGLSATYKLAGGKQEIQIFGGITPDSSSITNSYGQGGEAVGGLAYYLRMGKNSYGVQLWSNTISDAQGLYVGTAIRQYIGPKLLQIVDLVYNTTEAIVEKVRLRTSLRSTKATSIYVQYRSAGQFLYNAYPFVELTDLPNRQVVSLGGTYRLGRWGYLNCAVNQRLVYESRYITINASWRNFSVNAGINSLSSYTGQAMQVAYQRALFKNITVGSSLGLGSYSLIDDDAAVIAEAGISGISAANFQQTNLSATFWIKSSGASPIQYRLFGQYTNNRIYSTDGRIGLQVSYAL